VYLTDLDTPGALLGASVVVEPRPVHPTSFPTRPDLPAWPASWQKANI